MSPSSKQWFAWLMFLLGGLSWLAFFGMTWLLNSERTAFANALVERADRKIREESQSKLRSVVRETAGERMALENAVRMPIVTAVETIEASGKSAGVRSIAILEATPQTTASKELSAVSVLVQAEGSFESLHRALTLFETLPLITAVDQIQFERLKETWKLSVRLRVILALDTL